MERSGRLTVLPRTERSNHSSLRLHLTMGQQLSSTNAQAAASSPSAAPAGRGGRGRGGRGGRGSTWQGRAAQSDAPSAGLAEQLATYPWLKAAALEDPALVPGVVAAVDVNDVAALGAVAAKQPAAAAASVATLNRKGADALTTTASALVDLFADNARVIESAAEVERLAITCAAALLEDPEAFLQILKYKRHIGKGTGVRTVWTIAMMVVRELCAPHVFQEVLRFSVASGKDCTRIARIAAQSGADAALTAAALEARAAATAVAGVDFDLALLAERIATHIVEARADTDMWFKYIPSESGHFGDQHTRLLRSVNALLAARRAELAAELPTAAAPVPAAAAVAASASAEPSAGVVERAQAAASARELRVALSERLAKGEAGFTHSTFRRFVAAQKHRLNLIDELFQDEAVAAGTASAEDVCERLTKLSTLAFRRAESHVKTKGAESRLAAGMALYRERVASKQVAVKVAGLSPTADVAQAKWDDLTLARVERIVTEARRAFAAHRDAGVAAKLEVILDVSGSMDGTPADTAFYIGTILVEALGLKHITFFGSNGGRYAIDASTIVARHQQMYESSKKHGGGTQLDCAFKILLTPEVGVEGKTLLVLTDGDCDPSGGSSNNPFHAFLRATQTANVCVWNLSQEKLSFPYAALDRRVAYVSGNRAELIEPVLTAICTESTDLRPSAIMRACMTNAVFALPAALAAPACRAVAPPTVAALQRLVRGVMSEMPNGGDAHKYAVKRRAAKAAAAAAAGSARAGGAAAAAAAESDSESDDEVDLADDKAWPQLKK
jgi:hypothetical protein